MKRNKTGLILAICLCVLALICAPILTSVLDLGTAGSTAITVILCIAGPMLLIALFLCLFDQWRNKPFAWLPDKLAQEKLAEERQHGQPQQVRQAKLAAKRPLLFAALFGGSIFIIALFILGAAGWLGKMGAGVAFAVFVIVGPMALIALCLSLFGQWKRRPYHWLPEHLAQEKLAEDAAR